jgi:hypothetical protein
MAVEKLIAPAIAISRLLWKSETAKQIAGTLRDQVVDKPLRLLPAVRAAVTYLDKPEEDALNQVSEMAYLKATILLCEARLKGETVSAHNSPPEKEEKGLIEFIRGQLLAQRNENKGLSTKAGKQHTRVTRIGSVIGSTSTVSISIRS